MTLTPYFLAVISSCVISVIQKVHINSKMVVRSYNCILHLNSSIFMIFVVIFMLLAIAKGHPNKLLLIKAGRLVINI